MMFKVGDRVECLDKKGYENHLSEGSVYVVTEVFDAGGDGDCIGVVGARHVVRPYAKRFRLVEEDPLACGTPDQVNSPAHYISPGYAFEVIDAIEAWGLNYRCGAVVKYVARHLRKGKPLQDLRKAKWYLEREIAKREAAGEE